jgi:hypothetical protein
MNVVLRESMKHRPTLEHSTLGKEQVSSVQLATCALIIYTYYMRARHDKARDRPPIRCTQAR